MLDLKGTIVFIASINYSGSASTLYLDLSLRKGEAEQNLKLEETSVLRHFVLEIKIICLVNNQTVVKVSLITDIHCWGSERDMNNVNNENFFFQLCSFFLFFDR